MKLIIGLGNPGKEYTNTRHNIGFSFVDYYLDDKGIVLSWSKKFDGLYLKAKLFNEDVIFVKPQTYMNLSGNCVRKVMDYYNINVDDILVISDDLDLKIGNFKLKSFGSSGGHNGLKDIENKIHTAQYKRLKVGIFKNNNLDTKDYVLGKFSNEEISIINKLFKELCLVLDDYFLLPFADLMSKYNRKNR